MRPGAERADFDHGNRPAGQGGDFFHRAVLDFQQRNDQPGRRGQLSEHLLHQFARGRGVFAGVSRIRGEVIEPAGLFVGDVRKRHFPIALMCAQEIVTSPNGQTHEPVLERGVAAKAVQFMKRLEKHFLDDVFDFTFAAGVAAGGGEDTRLVLFQQRLEAGGVSTQHSRDQFRGGSFHSGGMWHSCRGRESGKPPRERGGFPVNPNQTVPESLELLPAEGVSHRTGAGAAPERPTRMLSSFGLSSFGPIVVRSGFKEHFSRRCLREKVTGEIGIWEAADRFPPEREVPI